MKIKRNKIEALVEADVDKWFAEKGAVLWV
jgi:hypothetical protein